LSCRVPDDHSATVASAACGADRPVLTGGGFWSGSAWLKGTYVVASYPDVDKGRWTAYEYDAGGTSSPDPFFTYAVCASSAALSLVQGPTAQVDLPLDPKAVCPPPSEFFSCSLDWLAPKPQLVQCPPATMALGVGVVNQGRAGTTFDPGLEIESVAPASADDGRPVGPWQVTLAHIPAAYNSPEQAKAASHDLIFELTALCATSPEAAVATSGPARPTPTTQPRVIADYFPLTRDSWAAVVAAAIILLVAALLRLSTRQRRRKPTHGVAPQVSTRLTVSVHVRGARPR
jgi:hypothetical protein